MRRAAKHHQILRAMGLNIKADSRKEAKSRMEFEKKMNRDEKIFDCIITILQETDEYLDALHHGNIEKYLHEEPNAGTKALEKLKRILGVNSWDDYFAECEEMKWVDRWNHS